MHPRLSKVTGFIAGALIMASASFASSSELAQPTGKPILTVSGSIDVTNGDGTARFDRGMLESLGSASFTTSTPWYEEPVTFEGVPMEKLMRAVGATGDVLVAVALNDYSVEVPVADFSEHGVILALKRNGEYMPVRDKGPLFIVYPFDSNPELRNQKFYSRSVWQVSRIEVK